MYTQVYNRSINKDKEVFHSKGENKQVQIKYVNKRLTVVLSILEYLMAQILSFVWNSPQSFPSTGKFRDSLLNNSQKHPYTKLQSNKKHPPFWKKNRLTPHQIWTIHGYSRVSSQHCYGGSMFKIHGKQLGCTPKL